jgi:hypothetical protein
VVALVLEFKDETMNHVFVLFHDCKCKAMGAYLVTEANGYSNSLPLRRDHVQDCLVDKDVLFLHLFNLKFKRIRQFNAVVQLWKLNHLALFDVYSQTPNLVKNF